MENKNILFLMADSNGGSTLPAVKGGAVATLVDHLLKSSIINNGSGISVISLYNKEAYKKSSEYPNIEFIWVKSNLIISILDKFTYFFVRTFLKKKKASSFKTPFLLLHYINFATKYLKHNSFSKVIIENNIPLVSVIEKSKYKGKFYYHLHNIPRTDFNHRDLFKMCDGFLCVSEYVANAIQSKESAIGPIPKNKTVVLKNVIDTQLFSPSSCQKAEDIRKKYNLYNKFVVLFTGRLSFEKGILELCKAFQSVKSENAVLLLVGKDLKGYSKNDSKWNQLQEIMYRIKDKLFFTGYIPQCELPNYYAVADLVVLPSIWDEPAGLTMIEALSCGKKLITTNSGGIPEYVKDFAIVLKRDEFLVKSISNLINDSISNKENQDLFIQKQRDYIVSNYDYRNYFNNLEECLKKL